MFTTWIPVYFSVPLFLNTSCPKLDSQLLHNTVYLCKFPEMPAGAHRSAQFPRTHLTPGWLCVSPNTASGCSSRRKLQLRGLLSQAPKHRMPWVWEQSSSQCKRRGWASFRIALPSAPGIWNWLLCPGFSKDSHRRRLLSYHLFEGWHDYPHFTDYKTETHRGESSVIPWWQKPQSKACRCSCCFPSLEFGQVLICFPLSHLL